VGLPGFILRFIGNISEMTYIVLARKWRPMTFEDVVGQDHVTQILMNALKNKRIAHAYIFAGPRGVGKTTTARLLAKAVNCEVQPAVNPCNKCASCKSITDGHSMDVIEIDGASNRGIDEIRNLRENIRFAPASSNYKIYIIDEVHMLTKEAFNALLKTLEEPPSHAIFIFATTEIHKVPLTILSRCQRFDFKRIALKKIQDLLQTIVKAEKIKIEKEALFLISRKADGSMRDAESILDQMISFGSGKLNAEMVRQTLGLIDQEIYFNFTDLLKEHQTEKILEYASQINTTGHDLVDYLHGLQEHFRNILLAKSEETSKIIDASDLYKDRYQETAKNFDEKDIIHFVQILLNAEPNLKYSTFPELNLEMVLLKIAFKPSSSHLEELIAFIEKVKKKPELIKSEFNDSNLHSEVKSAKIKEKVKSYDESASGGRGKSELTPQEKPEVSSQAKGLFTGLEKTLSNFQSLGKSQAENSTKKPEKELTLGEIQAKWEKIVETVRSQKIALGSFLQEGVPFEIENGKVIVAYDQQSSFHQEHVEKNKRVIEEIIKQEFDVPIQIGFKSIDFQKAGIQKQPRTPEEVLSDIKNKEPIIRKIIEVFDLDEKGLK
jgi:DNA polymerase-3 subunit gamma/tau